MIAIAFKCIGAAFLTALLFVTAGSCIYRKSITSGEKHPVFLQAGCSFFAGTALFLTVYQLGAFFAGNAKISLCLALATLLGISVVNFKKNVQVLIGMLTLKRLAALLVVSVIVFAGVINFWLFPYANPLSNDDRVYRDQHIGSIHSGQHANIASYILEQNEVPVYKTHHAADLLSSGIMLLGCNRPVFLLYIWLCFSHIAMILLMYGLFRFFSCTRRFAALSAYAVLFGSTALSMVHVMFVSTGTPFVTSGYADRVIAFGIFIFYLMWLDTLKEHKDRLKGKDVLPVLLICFILNVCWVVSANEYIFIALIILGALFFSSQWKKKINLFIVGACFVITMIIAMTQGGWFVPEKLITDMNKGSYVPVGYHTEEAVSGNITIEPGIFYEYASGPVFDRSTWDYMDNGGEALGRPVFFGKLKDVQFQDIWDIEVRLWGYMRILFWPILGFAILGLYLSAGKNRISGKEMIPDAQKMRLFFFFGMVTFVVGLIPAFSISGPRNWNWAFNRFLEPGYLFGLISLMLGVSLFLWGETKIKRYFVMGTLVVTLTIGPLLGHALPALKGRAFKKEFFKVLIETNGMIY